MRQHRALGGAVQAALKRTRIKLHNMQRQAAAGERADATKKQADLIMSALHSIRPGAASVQVRAACPLCWWLRSMARADSLWRAAGGGLGHWRGHHRAAGPQQGGERRGRGALQGGAEAAAHPGRDRACHGGARAGCLS